MSIMLPDQLIWILDKLGLEWPDIDEDEVMKAADLTRTLRDDLEEIIQRTDRKIVLEASVAARGKTGEAYVAAWTTNRSQNLQRLLDVLEPVPVGIDGGAALVIGLKYKFIAQLTWELGTLVPLLAAGPFGAAAAVAKLVATKITMGILVDLAVEKVVGVVAPHVIEPLTSWIPDAIQAVLDAPEVEDTGADPNEIAFDLTVLEQTEAYMEQCSADMEAVVSQYLSDIADLKITG